MAAIKSQNGQKMAKMLRNAAKNFGWDICTGNYLQCFGLVNKLCKRRCHMHKSIIFYTSTHITVTKLKVNSDITKFT